jgi:hypothetical protein
VVGPPKFPCHPEPREPHRRRKHNAKDLCICLNHDELTRGGDEALRGNRRVVIRPKTFVILSRASPIAAESTTRRTYVFADIVMNRCAEMMEAPQNQQA